SDRTANGIQSDGERNLIGRRTESDRTADGIRSDGERNRKEFQIIKNGKYRAKICKKSAF
uniref:hypothetical protein n=1 Tax=Prevotella sp. TaxID=59823 RepID=UPI0040260A66